MAYKPVPQGKYEISVDGGTTWLRLLNITGFTVSGGDREETTSETLDEGADVSVGTPRPKDISVTMEANPASQGYRAAFDAYKDEDRVQIRMRTNVKELIDNAVGANTIEVAAGGAITGAGAVNFQASPFGVGRGLVVDGNTYVIETITSGTAATVSDPSGADVTAVAASDDWQVTLFGVQYVLECEVLNAGNPDLSPGTPYTDSLTLKSVGVVPDPTFLYAP